MAYPKGGGSYSVSKANFGRLASLVAASALLIDYVLTVAVSISSASEQIVAAVPGLRDLQVEIAVAAIVLVTLGNLRGVRESGSIFAIPTYLFVGAALLMIGIGYLAAGRRGPGRPPPRPSAATEDLAGARDAAAAAPGVRVGRRGAHRRGGHRHRRARVQAARVQECRDARWP